MKKIVSVVGARPQFIKCVPLSKKIRKLAREVLVHTGQHYDYEMSKIFFDEMGIPEPDYNLGIGSDSHGKQTGDMLAAIEDVLLKEKPDITLVYGDTNSTLAGALAAAKLNIPVAHVEAGLRSFNRKMPEEINRIVTDHLSTWLFAPSEVAHQNLEKEGITSGVHVVGDIMYDCILLFKEKALSKSAYPGKLGLQPKDYYLCTIHRPENTDNIENLKNIFSALNLLDKKVVLPLHPRTRKMMDQFKIKEGENVILIEPVGYFDMLQLLRLSACVLTDSGGVQKEAYYLEVPCVTLRNETEWVETVKVGWNILCGSDPQKIVQAVVKFSSMTPGHPDLYGTGTASLKIIEILQ